MCHWRWPRCMVPHPPFLSNHLCSNIYFLECHKDANSPETRLRVNSRKNPPPALILQWWKINLKQNHITLIMNIKFSKWMDQWTGCLWRMGFRELWIVIHYMGMFHIVTQHQWPRCTQLIVLLADTIMTMVGDLYLLDLWAIIILDHYEFGLWGLSSQ